MRRTPALWTALFVALGAWIAAGAVIAEPDRAAAQTQSPKPVVIERVQSAVHLPGTEGSRPIAVLAIGSDARPGTEPSASLADSLHLITVNPKEGAATVLGFPRDSFVPIAGGSTRKINEALVAGGSEGVAQTISDLTGIPIDYTFLTAFEGFRKMVDGVGGFTVDIPYAMNDSASGASFEEGPAELGPTEALALARNRKSTPNGDFSRSENQGLILQAAQVKLRETFLQDPTVLFRWMVVGLANMETDLSLKELFELGVVAARVDPALVTNLVVPGGTGAAGGASVVFISDAAQPIYRDMADDGILNESAG